MMKLKLTNRPAKRSVKIVSVMAALLLLAAACSSDTDSDNADTDSVSTASDNAAPDSTAPDSTTTTTTDQGTDSPTDIDRGLGVSQALLDQLEECDDDDSLCGEISTDDGESVRYRVVPATGSEPPAGLIAFHFGGPGIDSTETLASLFANEGGRVPPGFGYEDFLGRFDLVAVEQRGTNAVTGVDCGNDALLNKVLVSTIPAAERSQLAKQWVSGCPTGAYGSVTAASDIATVLRYLDADRTVFVSYSYGGIIATQLGRDHADAVDAIVMDSTSTTDWIDNSTALIRARNYSIAFEQFLANCDETRSCRFAPDGNAAEVFQSLVDASEGTVDLVFAAEGLIQAPTFFDMALTAALDGDYSMLNNFAYALHGGQGELYPPGVEAQVLVACIDGASNNPDDYTELLEELRAYGNFGKPYQDSIAATLGVCEGWAGEVKPVELDLSQSEVPVLFVTSRNDTAVLWEYGKVFIETSLPEQSAAVVVDDVTHTLWLRGKTCIDEVVNAFVLDSTLPTISSPDGYEQCDALEAAGS